MKKITSVARISGAAVSCCVSLLFITTAVHAESTICPAGYVCTPVIAIPAQVASDGFCHIWSKNIRIGDADGDVSALRVALVKEGVVESSGIAGESFNEVLASGVVGFQEKYSTEILAPNGLRHGTGYVGPSTRSKLNALYGCGNTRDNPREDTVYMPPRALPTILTGPIVNPGNGHTYFLLSAMDWSSSESLATKLGGHLATIDDRSENSWIVEQFSNFGGTPRHLWIGLNDAESEGQWSWVSGKSPDYMNWASGEPNNGAGIYNREDAVHIWSPSWGYGRGTWNDAQDYLSYEGVVEIDDSDAGTSCTDNSVWTGTACTPIVSTDSGDDESSPSVISGPTVNPSNGHSYYILSASDRNSAEAKAVSLGGHLVTINDANENDWISTFGRGAGLVQHAWIGLNDSSREGDFTWSSGDPVTYLNWALGEPNNGAGVYDSEEAVSYLWNPNAPYSTGTWNDAQASLRYQGIVETQ